MKHTIKKMTAFLLTLAMLINILPVSVLADESNPKQILFATRGTGASVVISFYEADGTTPSASASLGPYNYIVSEKWGNLRAVAPVSVNGSVAEATGLDDDPEGSLYLIQYNGDNLDFNTLTGIWNYDPSGRLVSKLQIQNGKELGAYLLNNPVLNNGCWEVKATKQSGFEVNINFVDHDQSNPVTPGQNGAPAINEYSFVRASLADSTGATIGYAIKDVSTSGSSNGVVFSSFKLSNGGEISYADALANGYYVNGVRLGHTTDQNCHPNTNPNDWNNLNQGDFDGYTFVSNRTDVTTTDEEGIIHNDWENSTRATITIRQSDPIEYKVRVDCGDDALEIPPDYDLYAKVTIQHNNGPDTVGYVKLNDKSTDGGLTYEATGDQISWYENSQHIDDPQISGHEKNAKVELYAVPAGTEVNSPGTLNEMIPVGTSIQGHGVISTPSINNNYTYDENQTDPPRIVEMIPGVKTEITDVVYLEKNNDRFNLYTLEKILNGGYNVVTLCNGPKESMPKNVVPTEPAYSGGVGQGDAYIGCHQMGGVLIRGDVTFAQKVTGIADSPNADNPSVIGGYFGDTAAYGCFVNNRTNNHDDVPFYLGSSNTVIGRLVNGNKYEQELQGAKHGINYPGQTYVNDEYVNWSRLQNTVVNSSRAMERESTRTIDATGGGVVDVNIGEKVTINCGATDAITINLVGDGINTSNMSTAAGTVVTFTNAGNAKIPELRVNGSELSTVETGDGISIVYNYPNATGTIEGPSGSEFGHVVAPKALIKITGGNYSGTMIGNNAYIGADAEGHLYPYNGGQLVGFQAELDASKLLDGLVPNEKQKYTFNLYELSDSLYNSEYEALVSQNGTTDEEIIFWNNVGTVQNNGKEIAFKDISFYINGDHYFLLEEDTSSVGSNVNADESRYIIKVNVQSNISGATNTLSIGSVTYYKVINDDLVTVHDLVDEDNIAWGKGAGINGSSIEELGTLNFQKRSDDWLVDASEDIEFLNTQKKSGLTIKKVVTGTTDNETDFNFTLYVWNEETDEETQTVTYSKYDYAAKQTIGGTTTSVSFEETQYEEHAASKIEFTLKAGESMTFSELLVGAHYAFVEDTDSLPDGYSLDNIYGDDSGVISDSEAAVSIIYTNKYEESKTEVKVKKAWTNANALWKKRT